MFKSLVRDFLERVRGVPRSYRELERSLTLLSVLRGIGWHKSIRARGPVDVQGREIPWFSYPAIDWLESRINKTHKVLEFGAGHSTLWFARKAAHVTSIDHDAAWVQRLRPRLPLNASVILADPDHYVEAGGRSKYDIIVIDGIRRVECAQWSLRRVTRRGMIIFDNSDRQENADGLKALMKAGFYRIDFVGLVPQYGRISCTSVFFRDVAYLKIKEQHSPLGW
ncbi:MAG: hypothetical protein HBSIN02_22590 [Bacteroidia bacterium]|nr:MAG: hypothetical protein HBSIN02_22590 [Bacteroidia bacterium]